jgi:hypothetical protein
MSNGLWEFLGPTVALIILAGLLFLLAYSVRICSSDARRRGKSPTLVCIACILFFPWGTLAWLAFRPDPTDGPGAHSRFRLDDHRLQ